MKPLFFLLILISGSLNAKVQANTFSIDSARKLVYADYNAVIHGSATLYEEPSWDAAPVGELYNLYSTLQVNVIEQGDYREVSESETGYCDGFGYHWYYVATADGEEGWVYGKYLSWKAGWPFILSGRADVGEMQLSQQYLTIDEKIYWFDGAVDLGIGPDNEEGLTGCDRRFIPFFIDDETDEVAFIYMDAYTLSQSDGLISSSDHGHLMWSLESEGGSVSANWMRIATCNDLENSIVIEATHFYQDGWATVRYCISETDGSFYLDDFSIEDSR